MQGSLNIPPKKRGGHRRTESQAVSELENVFKSVDLEGNGQLDKASFSTVLFSLDMMVADDKLEELFNQIDVDKKGYVDYEELLELLRTGKIAKDAGGFSTLLDAAKTMPGSYSSANASLAMSSSMPSLNSSGGLTNPSTSMSSSLPKTKPKRKLDPKKKQIIQRAVIVIKKAAMKNISKSEVVEFLKDKGMNLDDIEYAYEKAQEQAMSPDERIRYHKQQAAAKDRELLESRGVFSAVSSKLSEANAQIAGLRDALLRATERLVKSDDTKYEDVLLPAKLEGELKAQIDLLGRQMQGLPEGQRNIIRKDANKLKSVSELCKEKKFNHAYLFMMTLEPAVQRALPITSSFLLDYDLSV